MKKGDFVIIAVVLAAAGGLYFSGVLSPGEKGGKAVVYVDGEKKEEFSLKKDGEYTVKTEGGYNTFIVESGEVNMIDADCPDKICVNHKPIYHKKESITCLPHKLVVEIEDGEENSIDAVVQ